MFLRTLELYKNDKINFYKILPILKEDLTIERKVIIDIFLINNNIGSFYYPQKYYDFYKASPTVHEIINSYENSEYTFEEIVAIIKIVLDDSKTNTALIALGFLDINYNKLNDTKYLEILIENNLYIELFDFIKIKLSKEEKRKINRLLKNHNKNKFFHCRLFEFFANIFHKEKNFLPKQIEDEFVFKKVRKYMN